MKCPVGWWKSMTSISNNNERKWNRQQYVGEALQEQGYCHTLVPNSVHWFPWAWCDRYDGLRQGYALVFCIFLCEEALSRDGIPEMGVLVELGRCVTAQKGVTGLPEGICSREGKVGDIFFFVISIARWNEMHIGSAPWNNKMVTVHWEEKWRRIVALDIGCNFDYGS